MTLRRGMSLIEVVTAVVVLSIAVPPTMHILADAASARNDSITTTRAALYAQALIEQIIADAASQAPGLGPHAFEDSQHYLNGLSDRLQTLLQPYTSVGMTHAIEIGPLAQPDGTIAQQPEENQFRRVTVEVSFSSSRGTQSLNVEVLLIGVSR